MAKRKLWKFAQLETFENAIQATSQNFNQDFSLKGKWSKEYFKNDRPIILELGCGKGEYSVGLAEKYPDINFIGIDVKGERLWRGCTNAQEKNLTNVVFIRTQIQYIENFFQKDEVSEIWVTFPDPQPQPGKSQKRLTSPYFLEKYRNILREDSIIHLKTDNAPLFDFTLETINEEKHQLIYSTHDLYSKELIDDILNIKTFYENKFLQQGIPICYLKFKLS
ncbi:MAG: tRNA (guanosine(46)-N7)-methyltransferase TrmB [Bacteroidetes bacterium]|nr:tRNA (guanosine(46)-N7)-methyltransferase TrmB [Bacteroidota bacterium]